MGSLVEPTGTRWEEKLPGKVTSALAAWVERRPFNLHLRGWFSDGRSGAPVARTVRELSDGRAQQLILKFWDAEGQRRVDDLEGAWHDSPYYHEHLAEVVDWTISLGDWRAILMRVAGGDLLNMAQLGSFRDGAAFPDYCATVVRSVLGDWNEHEIRRKQTTAADVLGEMLVRRWESIKQWARLAGVSGGSQQVQPFDWPEELANPLALAEGRDESYGIDDLIVGKAHGDLSGRNILMPSQPAVTADAYVLIDYDRYSTRAPLTRDPMHLLVALALDSFDNKVAAPLRRDLAKVIVDPNTPKAAWLGHFQKISSAIHSASKEMARAEGWGGQWEDQCLLSLVGAGLIHVGRDLRVEDQKAAKEWCFYLAALAAEEYVRRTPADNIVIRTRSNPACDKSRSLVDRCQELTALRTRLSDGPWGVLVVRGARGIGKTALVNAALTEVERNEVTRVQRHDMNVIVGLDASTLVDYVVGSGRAGPGEHRGSSLVRLENALHRHRDSRVVVTIDSAENLGDRDTGGLVDPELDDALELIATESGHRVTVLLVTRPDLRLPDGRGWSADDLLNVPKLPQREFFTYLTGLDQRGTLDLSSLSDESQVALYDKLRGNPRLAELVCGTVVADGGLDLGSLANALSSQDTQLVLAFLTRLLIDRLGPLHRRVLQALAAFDTAVPDAAVSQLLDGDASDDVGRALSELTENRVVYRVSSEPSQYFIPSDDSSLILDHLADEESRSDLYSSAADVLAEFEVKHPNGIADLRVHFAELRALLRAGEPGSAYEMLEKINDILRVWNCADLLLQRRLELRKSQLNDHLRMANENALGDLYLTRGDYREADIAYGNALKLSGRPQQDIRSVMVLTNLASMYWEINDTDRALGYYQLCLDEAVKRENPKVRMGALEGLADCYRRRGDYEHAIRYAEEALAVAPPRKYQDTPATGNSTRTRTVMLSLKLARWHGELGNLTTADGIIERIAATAGTRRGEWLHAAIQDGRADRYLNLGELELAAQAADQAVDEALALHDPIILLQARTTLCVVCLKDQYIRQAGVHIAGALRHRRPGRSLVLLALSALAARQKGDLHTAHQRFGQLLKESDDRIDKDPKDFTAWDFRGVALCGQQLDAGTDFDQALLAFERARSLTPPTPVLVERLRFVLTQLDECGSPAVSLRPVIDGLADPTGRYS